MLLHIRDYICREQIISTQQLARVFHLDHSALQPMLDLWVRKGVIKPCDPQGSCASACFKCSVKKLEYYQYIPDHSKTANVIS